MFKGIAITAWLIAANLCSGQESASAKPVEHVLGTVVRVDPASHTITVKDDKTGAQTLVLLEKTRTLLKVPPGAKDLKSATRITSDDLEVNDRVDVRGTKPEDNPNAITARSVLLMSGRELAKEHQAEAAAWQHSTAGTVNSIDAAGQKLEVTVRTPEGPKPATVTVSPSTEFTRYSPENPKVPAPSQLSDIQTGDQVRIIGEKSEDGAAMTAQKIYSGAFRTIAGTVTAISADGKQLTITDLQTKRPVLVALTSDSTIRKLPPMMAMGLARRLNPDLGAAQGTTRPENAGNTAGAPPYGAKAGETAEQAGANPNAAAHPMRTGNGDLSRMLERAPAIAITDLKTGDAVVVSGAAAGPDKGRLIASSIIAGVEPIFQSAPPRQGQSLGDWSLSMEAPAQ
jgi:hypothetical protein